MFLLRFFNGLHFSIKAQQSSRCFVKTNKEFFYNFLFHPIFNNASIRPFIFLLEMNTMKRPSVILFILITFALTLIKTLIETSYTLFKLEMKWYYNIPMTMIGTASSLFYVFLDGFAWPSNRLIERIGVSNAIVFFTSICCINFLASSRASSYGLF